MQIARRAATCRAVAHTDHRDPVQVRRAYVFRAYPTRPQEGRAVKLLRDHCDLYNAALEERREAWRMRNASVSYGMQSAQLRDIRKADPGGQGMHSFTAQEQTLRRLNDAFAAFFKRARNGDKKPGYPRFKPYSRFRQVRFVNGHRCRARCARPRQDTVICPVCGPMDADLNGAINIASRAGLGSGHAAPAA
jgi:transposase